MPHESGPDETLSPDEAYAWSVIERSLRRDLPLQRIERRARLRADRSLLLASCGVVLGFVVAALAASAPAALVALGMTTAGASLGIMIVRALLAVVASGRTRSAAPSRRRSLRSHRRGLFER